MPRSVPATTKCPSSKWMSASAASNASAAIRLPFSINDVGGAPDGGAAHIGGARAAMPATERDRIGVTLHQPNHVVRQAEPVGKDLRKGGLVSLEIGRA